MRFEHARRRDDSHGAHDPGIDTEGKMVHFEACAASWARLAKSKGAIARLIEHVEILAKEFGENAASLGKTAQKLEEMRDGLDEIYLNLSFKNFLPRS